MSGRSAPADSMRGNARHSQPQLQGTLREAPGPGAEEGPRRVVLAHYAWVARATRRQARIAEASALAEIGGDDHAPETVSAEPLPESSRLAPEPTPSLWRAALAYRLEQIAAMIRRRPAQDSPRAARLSGLS